MRVYLAGSDAVLRDLVGRGRSGGPWDGFAATPALRAELGDLADEDLEFALSVAAGEASAAMSGDVPGHSRRIVLVVDVDDGLVTADPQTPGAVAVAGPVSLDRVDAVLADPHDGPGHGGAADELAWYATQEIAELLVRH